MNYMLFDSPQESYKVVILLKKQDLNEHSILSNYIEPLIKLDSSLSKKDFLVLEADYVDNKAPSKTVLLPCLARIEEYVLQSKATHLLIAAPEYFKKITNKTNLTTLTGSPIEASYSKFKGIQCFNIPSHRSVFFDDKNVGKIDLALTGLSKSLKGQAVFQDIVHTGLYPSTLNEVAQVLDRLLQYPVLACDIEAHSLDHTKAKIATISFAWSEHEGTAFKVELDATESFLQTKYILLYNFFNEFLGRKGGKLIFHNINYDAKVIIHELFQIGSISAKASMLNGIELFTKNFEDTKLIAYLATNSCSGNELSLKTLALPFTGNYGLDSDKFESLSSIPEKELLLYNLKDALATFWVYKQYYPKLLQDKQEVPYKTIFKPAVKTLLQMELHGMPIYMERVIEVEKILINIRDTHLNALLKSPLYSVLENINQINKSIEFNLKWKTKTGDFNSFKDLAVNITNLQSGDQLIPLIYDYLGLPVISKTDKGSPSTSGKVLSKLKNHVAKGSDAFNFLNDLVELSKVNKILSAFIPAFKKAKYDPITDFHYLFGNFNLGGTVSGRLSCKQPNLQQIPSGSTYAKLIKSCFKAPKGYLMVGLDFDSLEDYVSALTTKDPNKLSVYIDKFDGHCLRAASYFPEQLPDIYQVEDGTKCFSLDLEEKSIVFSENDQIVYKGNTYSGKEFFYLMKDT